MRFCTLCCPNGNFSQGKFGSLSPRKASCNAQTVNGQWYQHLLTLFAIFYESSTEGTNSWITLIIFNVCKMYMFCIVFNLGKI